MSELATTRATPDLAVKAERRRQKFALKEWEGSATRAAHDARVRSAKSQYADIFHANGNTPGARRRASPAGAPSTPAAGSYATTEMARRARRTPPSNARLARTPKTPESSRVASRANGADASGGRNLDAALAASPPRETPGSRIRAAAAVALSPDSKYRAERFGESAGGTEASPGARGGPDLRGGVAFVESPLGPESSLGGSRLARRGSSRSPASRLPSPPAARRALGDEIPGESAASGERVASEPATPEAARSSKSAPRAGSSARPSTGRNLARFLKRRQALRRAEAEAGERLGPRAEKGARAERLFRKEADEENVGADKENVDPAWAEYETFAAAKKATPREEIARAPLAPLGTADLSPLEKEHRAPHRALGVARGEDFLNASSPPSSAKPSSASREPREPFFVRDDEEDAYPPTPAESPSPLRAANAETHAAWIDRGYGAIRASAAAAAPRYAEEDEPESDAGSARDFSDDDAWNEYAGEAATIGGFDEARVEPFKMVSPGALRRAAAETARSASLARYA